MKFDCFGQNRDSGSAKLEKSEFPIFKPQISFLREFWQNREQKIGIRFNYRIIPFYSGRKGPLILSFLYGWGEGGGGRGIIKKYPNSNPYYLLKFNHRKIAYRSVLVAL